MRVKRLRRAVMVLAVVVIAVGASMVSAGTAWAMKERSPEAMPRFDGMTSAVEVTIPTDCPIVRPVCQWVLFVNEPDAPGKPVAGFEVGTSGVLSVPFPPYCGVIQADVLVGPKPWKMMDGVRAPIEDCPQPTTTTTTSTSTTTTSTSTTTTSTSTTTTTSSTTTTTTTTRPSTTTTTKVPAVVASASTTPNGSSDLPFTDDTTASTVAKAADGSSQLPYTGAPVRLLLLLGITLMLLGAVLLTSLETRRRMVRRVASVRVDDLKDGADRMSSWFLGR